MLEDESKRSESDLWRAMACMHADDLFLGVAHLLDKAELEEKGEAWIEEAKKALIEEIGADITCGESQIRAARILLFEQAFKTKLEHLEKSVSDDKPEDSEIVNGVVAICQDISSKVFEKAWSAIEITEYH